VLRPRVQHRPLPTTRAAHAVVTATATAPRCTIVVGRAARPAARAGLNQSLSHAIDAFDAPHAPQSVT